MLEFVLRNFRLSIIKIKRKGVKNFVISELLRIEVEYYLNKF